jgi:hypothetical protein
VGLGCEILGEVLEDLVTDVISIGVARRGDEELES